MKKNRGICWIISGLLLSTSPLIASADMPTEVEPAFLKKNFFPPRPRIVDSDEHEEAKWLLRGTGPKLQKEDYDGLEKMAQEARSSKAVFSNGYWHLTQFYKGVTSYGGRDPKGDQSIAMLTKWATARPQSITAQIALAEGLVDYAWTARGHSGSNDVTETGWALFRERLDQARMVLREARKLPDKDPHWWAVALQVGLGQQWDRVTYDGLYNEAIAFEPTYYPYYFHKTTYLLDRWYGEMGDPERFAAEASDALGKLKGQAQGDALYARLFWSFDTRHLNEISYGVPALTSIARIERGMQELARQYPDNVIVYGAWLQMYYRTQALDRVGNKAKALELLPKTRNIVDSWVWHNMDEYYPAIIWATQS
jgi:hypothetical protein